MYNLSCHAKCSLIIMYPVIYLYNKIPNNNSNNRNNLLLIIIKFKGYSNFDCIYGIW